MKKEKNPTLEKLRESLTLIDDGITDLLNHRIALVSQIGQEKQRVGAEVYDPEREFKVMERAKQRSRELSSSAVITIYSAIFSVMRQIQDRIKEGKKPTQQWTVETIGESAILFCGGAQMLALPKDRRQHLERIAERHEQERR